MTAAQTAYARGYSNLDGEATQYFASRNRAGIEGAKEAARSWRKAASDHAETSYWGAVEIRAMRAYWLGVARGILHRTEER